jgi:hypothetical protein
MIRSFEIFYVVPLVTVNGRYRTEKVLFRVRKSRLPKNSEGLEDLLYFNFDFVNKDCCNNLFGP